MFNLKKELEAAYQTGCANRDEKAVLANMLNCFFRYSAYLNHIFRQANQEGDVQASDKTQLMMLFAEQEQRQRKASEQTDNATKIHPALNRSGVFSRQSLTSLGARSISAMKKNTKLRRHRSVSELKPVKFPPIDTFYKALQKTFEVVMQVDTTTVSQNDAEMKFAALFASMLNIHVGDVSDSAVSMSQPQPKQKLNRRRFSLVRRRSNSDEGKLLKKAVDLFKAKVKFYNNGAFLDRKEKVDSDMAKLLQLKVQLDNGCQPIVDLRLLIQSLLERIQLMSLMLPDENRVQSDTDQENITDLSELEQKRHWLAHALSGPLYKIIETKQELVRYLIAKFVQFKQDFELIDSHIKSMDTYLKSEGEPETKTVKAAFAELQATVEEAFATYRSFFSGLACSESELINKPHLLISQYDGKAFADGEFYAYLDAIVEKSNAINVNQVQQSDPLPIQIQAQNMSGLMAGVQADYQEISQLINNLRDLLALEKQVRQFSAGGHLLPLWYSHQTMDILLAHAAAGCEQVALTSSMRLDKKNLKAIIGRIAAFTATEKDRLIIPLARGKWLWSLLVVQRESLLIKCLPLDYLESEHQTLSPHKCLMMLLENMALDEDVTLVPQAAEIACGAETTNMDIILSIVNVMQAKSKDLSNDQKSSDDKTVARDESTSSSNTDQSVTDGGNDAQPQNVYLKTGALFRELPFDDDADPLNLLDILMSLLQIEYKEALQVERIPSEQMTYIPDGRYDVLLVEIVKQQLLTDFAESYDGQFDLTAALKVQQAVLTHVYWQDDHDDSCSVLESSSSSEGARVLVAAQAETRHAESRSGSDSDTASYDSAICTNREINLV